MRNASKSTPVEHLSRILWTIPDESRQRPVTLNKVSALKYCNRVEKNWMLAMGLLNEQPHKLEEYVILKFEMKTFEKRFARATALTEKLELQSQWEKFCAMEPVYEKASACVWSCAS